MTTPNSHAKPARAVYDFIRSHRVLSVPAGWLSRVVASSPPSSPLSILLGPLRKRLRDAMRVEDVVWVLGILEAERVPFSIAGGWGVDALLGRQSRAHHDLDVVVDDYDHEVPRAIAALQANGFEVVGTHERRAWMPRLSVLMDGAGHQVEFVSLDWDRLASEFGPPGADGAARKTFEQRVFGEGTVVGRRVPCLSAEVQLLYHIGFDLAPDMRRDMSLLHDELGASLSDSPEP